MDNALNGTCLTHHCPARIRAEYDRSETLGALLLAGAEMPEVSTPKTLYHTHTVSRFSQGEAFLEMITEAA